MIDDVEQWNETRRASLGQVLIRTARRYDEHAIERLRAHVGVPVRRAHLALFAHIDLSGTRPTEIARRHGVSKQAVGALLRDLIEWGMLEQVPDPADGRATLVRFSTAAGRSLEDGLAVLGEVEALLVERLGRDALDQLHALLLAVDDAFDAF